MNQKDHIVIAGAIKNVVFLAGFTCDAGKRLAIACTARSIADCLELDNPKFKRHKFLVNCGIEHE